MLPGEVDRGGRVFGEAGASETGSREKKLGADPAIEAHPASDGVHVRAHELAKPRDLVDERDLDRQKAVRRVLDQLRGSDVRDHERRFREEERAVDLRHDLDRAGVGSADHDAVGAQEVGDRRAFPEKLGVGDD